MKGQSQRETIYVESTDVSWRCGWRKRMSDVYIRLDIRHQFIAWENVWCLCGTIVKSRVQPKNRLRDISRQLCHSLWILPLGDAARLLRGIVFEPQVLGRNVSLESQEVNVPVVEILSIEAAASFLNGLQFRAQKNGGKNELGKFGAQVWAFELGNAKNTAPAGRVHWLSAVPHRHPWTDLERLDRIRESVWMCTN